MSNGVSELCDCKPAAPVSSAVQPQANQIITVSSTKFMYKVGWTMYSDYVCV